MEAELLDVVAVTEDVPDAGLVRGQMGTIVERYPEGDVEVEFLDDEGYTYALMMLRANQWMRLSHAPGRELSRVA